MPMSLVVSLTIAQKIANTRKTDVSETMPKINITSTISFLTAPMYTACCCSHVTMRMFVSLGTSPG